MTDLQSIYLEKIKETNFRLTACERLLTSFNNSKDVLDLESAILQIRKSLEAIAFASVAPNKRQYAEYRAKADKNKDFTKDFNARAILQHLSKVNADFFPIPLSAPMLVSPDNWHFEIRNDNSLTKEKFENFYDRLGKHLHADNPWGNDKGLTNIANDIPEIILAIRTLLSWHLTTIRTPDFTGVWVVKVPINGDTPSVIVGQADGDFIIKKST